MPEPHFALLQTRHERIEPAIVLEALIAGAGQPKADAVRASIRCRGILAERLTHQQAEGARAILSRQQVETLVVPAEQMLKLTPPVSVHWLRTEDAGLLVPLDYYGQTATVPWPSVFVVSSGVVKKELEERKPYETEEVVFGGLPTLHGMSRRRQVTQYKSVRRTERQHITEIIAVSVGGQLLHFRLHAHRLHKQQVPLGGVSVSIFEKDLLLLADLLRRAPLAETSPETGLLLQERLEQPPEASSRRPYEFDEASFDLYNRWLLQLVRLREQGLIAS